MIMAADPHKKKQKKKTEIKLYKAGYLNHPSTSTRTLLQSKTRLILQEQQVIVEMI